MSRKARFSISLPESQSWHHYSLIEIGSNSDILIAPFDGQALCFKSEEIGAWLPSEFHDHSTFSELSNSEYLNLLQKAIEFCDSDDKKVVCSRSEFVECSIDLSSGLNNLRKAYPNAFIYLLELNNQIWIGASPELLVRREGNTLQTHSLAGTIWNNNPFTEKEIKEQEIVTKSILNSLRLSPSFATSPKEVDYGPVKHLKSIIKWENGGERAFSDAIKSLHPTPAVCGYPKNDARRFILEHEPNDRELYTGYITCELEGVSYAFVNLRCAKVFSNGIQIFAGGGINRWSDPESEWMETKQKIDSVKNVLVSSDNNK